MGWIYLSQKRDKWWTDANSVMNLWVPSNAGNSWASSGNFGFSRRTLFHGIH
jgi:hypothetical protein